MASGSSSTADQRERTLNHLDHLESEAIFIIREAMAEARKPVMLYSVGKDSSVLLHLALKAFYPAPIPFPLLHIDTGWKFKSMYTFRDKVAKSAGIELIVHTNEDGLKQGINPFDHGPDVHTRIMKTEALKQALERHSFDVALGGARRDEEKSRAKERIFSFRSSQHHWNPKKQRPEPWDLFYSRLQEGELLRVFPLSNWTEQDIWTYIHREDISISDLYLAAERPVVHRDGNLIMVDDDRFPFRPGEETSLRRVRFRTLGCWPLTGATLSNATTLPEVLMETFQATKSERNGRVIDQDMAASMEQKKQEGYF